jgi:hypothetical protein
MAARRSTSLIAALARFARRLRGPVAPVPSADAAGLEHCRVCSRDFVNPMAWEPVGEDAWWMLLRCGECGIAREVTVADDEADRFDLALNRRATPIARALERLDLERMAAEVETLIVALRRDLIDASDFAR